MNFCPLDKRCYHSIIIVIWNHQGLLKLLLTSVMTSLLLASAAVGLPSVHL